MFTVNIKIKDKNPDFYKKIAKHVKKVSRRRVVAGFPKGRLNHPHYEGANGKPGPSIIDVAIWNNFGVPEMNIPRRDFMTPASKKWKEKFEESVKAVQEEIIQGKFEIDTFLGIMGEDGAEIIREEITKLQTPPNAPITIEGGWMRNKKSGKPFKVQGKGSSNPLVDSGDMSKAPTWELRERE